MCSSDLLDLPVYDTQCGAKLFRNTEIIKQVFSKPFFSRWIFDVEILSRLLLAFGQTSTKDEQPIILEHPLALWNQVDGSRLKPSDFARAAFDLAKIAQKRYFEDQR